MHSQTKTGIIRRCFSCRQRIPQTLKTWLETAFIQPDCTASPLFVGILYNVFLFLPYLSKAVMHLPSSVRLSAASSSYRWTGEDSDHEVAPLLPFIIPSWRLRSGLTPALPLPFLFLSLHTAFLISLGHPIQSHETGDHCLSIKRCHLVSTFWETQSLFVRQLGVGDIYIVFLPSFLDSFTTSVSGLIV